MNSLPKLLRKEKRLINLVLYRYEQDVKYLVQATSGYMSERQRVKAAEKEIRLRNKSQR